MEHRLPATLDKHRTEISNVLDIIRLVATTPLDVPMTSLQKSAVLKDQILALQGGATAGSQDINAVASRMLVAINDLLGTAYTMEDLRSGTVSITRLTDAIKGSLFNKKLLVYKPVVMGQIGNLDASACDLSEILGELDSSDWSLALAGSYGAPYNTATPVLAAQNYNNEFRVDVVDSADGLALFNASGYRVVGYVSGYDTNSATITWGYIDENAMFFSSPFPTILASANVTAIIPLKSNLGILSLSGLAQTKRDGFASVKNSDVLALQSALSANGLGADTTLAGMLGVSQIKASEFVNATRHALVADGYASVVEAIRGILGLIEGFATSSGDSRGLFNNLNSFVGKADVDIVPNYTVYGDVRDVIGASSSLKDAVSALNAAMYEKNVLTVAASGGNFTSISSALSMIALGNLGGIPSANNAFVVKVAPGLYSENVVLVDYVDVEGSGVDHTVIQGSVSRPANVHAAIRNCSIRFADAGAALTLAGTVGENQQVLQNLFVEHLTNDIAIRVCSDANVKLETGVIAKSGGVAIEVDGENVALEIGDAALIGAPALMAKNNSWVMINGGMIDGQMVITGAEFLMVSGDAKCASDALVASSSTGSTVLDLIGGRISGGQRDLVQTDTSTVIRFGGCAVNKDKVATETLLISALVPADGITVKSQRFASAKSLAALVGELDIELGDVAGDIGSVESRLTSAENSVSSMQGDVSALQTSSHVQKHALDSATDHEGSLPEASVAFVDGGHNHSGGAAGAQIAHSSLSDAGTNSHANIDAHIADSNNPHAVTVAQIQAVAASKAIARPQVDVPVAVLSTSYYQIQAASPVFVGQAGSTDPNAFFCLLGADGTLLLDLSNMPVKVSAVTSDQDGLLSVIGQGYVANPYIHLRDSADAPFVPNVNVRVRYGVQDTLGNLPEDFLLTDAVFAGETEADVRAAISAVRGPDGLAWTATPPESLYDLSQRVNGLEAGAPPENIVFKTDIIADINASAEVVLIGEAKISDDDILARVASDESISGKWSFPGGIIVEYGTALPAGVIEDGRFFIKTDTKQMFIGASGAWQSAGGQRPGYLRVLHGVGEGAISSVVLPGAMRGETVLSEDLMNSVCVWRGGILEDRESGHYALAARGADIEVTFPSAIPEGVVLICRWL